MVLVMLDIFVDYKEIDIDISGAVGNATTYGKSLSLYLILPVFLPSPCPNFRAPLANKIPDMHR